VQPPSKAIPPARDRLQSRLLVGMVVPVLVALVVLAVSDRNGVSGQYLLAVIGISGIFALLAYLTKSATVAAAACGALMCLQLTLTVWDQPSTLGHSLLPPLALLFVVTSLATRFRRARKEASGIAEARSGRRASQAVANLGVAALYGAFSHVRHTHVSWFCYLGALSALAEATADTLSSEIGQGIAGSAFLITNLRRVPAGTDGAISLAGTFAGILGAAAVILAGLPRPFWSITPLIFTAVFLAALAGLFFDSLLGATLERRGWLGNDRVNFFSTVFAAAVSYPLTLLALHFLRS
jgi:uncharacterized protein (TIGR00297 family)